jgi:hypothetical protein
VAHDVTAAAPARPFAPSPLDRLVDAIRRGRVPPHLLYAALALVLVLTVVAVTWADGTFPDDFRFIHVMLPVYAMALLPSYHYRNDVAVRAFAQTRPLLVGDEQELAALEFRLVHLPNRTLVAGATGGLLLLAAAMAIRPEDSDERLAMMTSPAASVVEGALQLLVWTGVGITTAHILTQIRVVNEIYTRHVRADLFTLGPLYALSRLAAVNTLFTVAVVVVASLALSQLATTAQWAAIGGAALLLAAASFLAPVWGAHRLLSQQKTRHRDALRRRSARTLDRLQELVDEGDFEGAAALNDVIAALTAADKAVDDVSTWPWDVDTGRAVITGLLAPIVIWLVTTVLDRLAF